MEGLLPDIPELRTSGSTVRVAPLRNAPLPDRIAMIIDHPAFQRLRSVRQLGPTHLVYPGAVHTRFEHSIGVYDMAMRYLRALSVGVDPAPNIRKEDAEALALAALLHDIGHYPFAHSLEAVHVEGQETPRHEDLARAIIRGDFSFLDQGSPSIGAMITSNFDVAPEDVIQLISGSWSDHEHPGRRLMASILSSGIDADKADYLERDSVHMGVPYGRNYDRGRFLHSLCVHPDGDRIALTDKGRVSAEIFIFGRYTMFSEAYWHHTVRAVSVMVEQAIANFRREQTVDDEELVRWLLSYGDDVLLERLVEHVGAGSEAHAILSRLTGHRRQPYKRLLTLSRVYDDTDAQLAYERIYHLNASARDEYRRYIRDVLSERLGVRIERCEVLVDTPPRDKDQMEVPDIVSTVGGNQVARSLADSSKVVQGIANDFIKVVKRIRIFVHPRLRQMVEDQGMGVDLREFLIARTLEFSPETDFQQSML